MSFRPRAVPYALYVANGSVGIQEGAGPDVDLSCCPGFSPAFAYFYEYIEEVRKGAECRHNIVHRYALSNKDRMTVCDATSDDVRDLIQTIVVFVEDMKGVCGLRLWW